MNRFADLFDISVGSADELAGQLFAIEQNKFEDVTFETHGQAFARYKELFKDTPEMLKKATKPTDLPESYQFSLADEAGIEAVVRDLERTPGVDQVAVFPEGPL